MVVWVKCFMLSFIINAQILTSFVSLGRAPGLLSFLSFFWDPLPFYILRHRRENLVWELFSIVFFLLLVFCRIEQEITNSSQQKISSTQTKIICSHMTWTTLMVKIKSLQIFLVTDILSLHYSSASWSLQKPGA